MSGWTCDRSSILSLLLDEVTGTKEAVHTRQDFCMMFDAIWSCKNQMNMYYTGSRSEGLELPGSDDDYMFDINKLMSINVIQSPHELLDTSLCGKLHVCTKNVDPGFALLRCSNIQNLHPFLKLLLRRINGFQYISSNLTMDFILSSMNLLPGGRAIRKTRQGPSMEYWTEYKDRSEPGADTVPSIHCSFCPQEASEWAQRPRQYGWPKPHDISSILTFGCHLVPIGHPNSHLKFMQWRFSFSIAERTLAWSFNHVQMQCYAVMKLILKEFIKKRCAPENQVLCSYFIKTFLFWEYEATEINFWRQDNFKECVMYLLHEFSSCIREGVLRHYFFPRFNLLQVKLTREAQTELLQLFDVIIQRNISILNECETTRNIWSKCLSADSNQMKIIDKAKRTNFLKNDEFMIETFTKTTVLNWAEDSLLYTCIDTFLKVEGILPFWNRLFEDCLNAISTITSFDRLISHIATLSFKTCLGSLVLKRLLFEKVTKSYIVSSENKEKYRLHRIVHSWLSLDTTTYNLWYAILLLMQEDYMSTLRIVNNVLFSIPSFAIYKSASSDEESVESEAKILYVNMFRNTRIKTLERARTAWLLDMIFPKYRMENLPLAIQIEFCDIHLNLIIISPYTCIYYLMFLCHHALHQFDDRAHALRQLVDVINNTEQCPRNEYLHHSYNIAGHCLLMAGETDRAHELFIRSYQYTRKHPPWEKYNSASWYLQQL